MHEETLKSFFLGQLTPQDLINDAKGRKSPAGLKPHTLQDREAFELTIDHLVQLCELVLEGTLKPQDLEAIGQCLAASDRFYWEDEDQDGKLITNVIHMWADPDSTHPLNDDTVFKYREYLLTGTDPFDK